MDRKLDVRKIYESVKEKITFKPVSYTHLDVYKRQVVGCAGADPPVPSFLRECISAEVPIYRDFRCFCGSRWQNASDLYNSCFCDMIGFIKMQHIRR